MRTFGLILLYLLVACLIMTNIYFIFLCLTVFKGTVALLFYGYAAGAAVLSILIITITLHSIMVIIDKIRYR